MPTVGWVEQCEAQQHQTVGLHCIQPNLPFTETTVSWAKQREALSIWLEKGAFLLDQICSLPSQLGPAGAW